MHKDVVIIEAQGSVMPGPKVSVHCIIPRAMIIIIIMTTRHAHDLFFLLLVTQRLLSLTPPPPCNKLHTSILFSKFVRSLGKFMMNTSSSSSGEDFRLL